MIRRRPMADTDPAATGSHPCCRLRFYRLAASHPSAGSTWAASSVPAPAGSSFRSLPLVLPQHRGDRIGVGFRPLASELLHIPQPRSRKDAHRQARSVTLPARFWFWALAIAGSWSCRTGSTVTARAHDRAR